MENARVVDFLKPISKKWDLAKLRGCIPEEQVQAVCKIPVSLSNASDNLGWHHTNSGKYTVKSGYFQRRKSFARTRSNSASSSFTPSKSMWTRLWNSCTNPKVRTFMWRAARNWLTCKENLCRRKCSPNPTCPLCENAVETVEHMLFHCPWSRAVWFGSGKHHWILSKSIVAMDKWLKDLLCGCLSKETSSMDVETIFQLCWAIWKARNKWVFSRKVSKPEEVIEQARATSIDYLQAVCDRVKRPSPDRVERPSLRPPWKDRWSPPPTSVIKFNCDRAFKSSRNLAAFGFVARDSGGRAQVWRCGRVMISSALAIEAWALRIACSVAKQWEDQEVIFESDCQALINCIKDPKVQCPWEIGAFVTDIWEWARTRKWTFG
ncbi:uncharacterized protein LOC131313959 [Rhododendron vialii]|uniref:uncharacterized protein LOC131313959 n=1 Tax=Rhododendron vialii TaxID=182163 RepID=UPI00265FE7FC|nr:uncharacterized protein LOC131313959 [Rhododendron vialii]